MSYEDDCNEYYFGIPFKKRVSAAEPEPKFKVGDRVRADGGYSFGPHPGTVVEVGAGYYGVRLDIVPNGKTCDVWNYLDDELTLAPTIAIGDRVKLTRHFGPHAMGDEGKVCELITKAGFVNAGVEMDPWGVYTVFPVEALERAADCAERKEQRVGTLSAETLHIGDLLQSKFRAGDEVRCLKSCSDQFTAGRYYVVREVPTKAWLSFVSDDRGSKTNGWAARHFELVTALASQPAIVARVLDGQPRPSNIPYVHASVSAATEEAERLAKNNPGQEFAVYQRVGARVCEAQTTYNMKEVA